MADASLRDAEAVMDEVALLEAALREAVERRQAGSMQSMHVDLSHEMSSAKRFDVAVAAYGVQLRAWIDLQVDARLHQVLHSCIDNDLMVARQNGSAAVTAVNRLEGELGAVAEAQAKLLAVIEGVSEELSRLKVSVSSCSQSGTSFVGSISAVREEAVAHVERSRAEMLGTVEDLKRNLHSQGQRQEEAVVELQDLRRRHEEHRGTVGNVPELLRELLSTVDSLKRNMHCQDERHKEFASALQELQHWQKERRGAEGDLQELYRGLRETVEDIKRQLHTHGQRHDEAVNELQDVRRWQQEHRSMNGDIQHLHQESTRHRDVSLKHGSQVEDLMRQVSELSTNQSEWRRDLVAEEKGLRSLQSELATVANLSAEQEARLAASLDARFEALRRELSPEDMRSHLEVRIETNSRELRTQMEALQTQLSEQCIGMQQKVIAELRAETTAAFKSEAAAVAALDEQLWLTDQRLGQRIDELAHLHVRERAAIAERIAIAKRAASLSPSAHGHARTSDSPESAQRASPDVHHNAGENFSFSRQNQRLLREASIDDSETYRQSPGRQNLHRDDHASSNGWVHGNSHGRISTSSTLTRLVSEEVEEAAASRRGQRGHGGGRSLLQQRSSLSSPAISKAISVEAETRSDASAHNGSKGAGLRGSLAMASLAANTFAEAGAGQDEDRASEVVPHGLVTRSSASLRSPRGSFSTSSPRSSLFLRSPRGSHLRSHEAAESEDHEAWETSRSSAFGSRLLAKKTSAEAGEDVVEDSSSHAKIITSAVEEPVAAGDGEGTGARRLFTSRGGPFSTGGEHARPRAGGSSRRSVLSVASEAAEAFAEKGGL